MAEQGNNPSTSKWTTWAQDADAEDSGTGGREPRRPKLPAINRSAVLRYGVAAVVLIGALGAGIGASSGSEEHEATISANRAELIDLKAQLTTVKNDVSNLPDSKRLERSFASAMGASLDVASRQSQYIAGPLDAAHRSELERTLTPYFAVEARDEIGLDARKPWLTAPAGASWQAYPSYDLTTGNQIGCVWQLHSAAPADELLGWATADFDLATKLFSNVQLGAVAPLAKGMAQ